MIGGERLAGDYMSRGKRWLHGAGGDGGGILLIFYSKESDGNIKFILT